MLVRPHATYSLEGTVVWMTERENPWILHRENVCCAPTDELASVEPRRAWQPGAEVAAQFALVRAYPTIECEERFWLVGAHGGAGTSTWASLLDAADGGCQWPSVVGGADVVIVCRSSMAGLEAARRAGMQWASGAVPDVDLRGLLVVPDLPGRLPKPLREAAAKTAGAFPTTIYAPWVGAWRMSVRAELGSPSRHLTRALDAVFALRKEHE